MKELSRRVHKENARHFTKPTGNITPETHVEGGLHGGAGENPWWSSAPVNEYVGSKGIEAVEGKVIHPAAKAIPAIQKSIVKSQLGNMHNTLMNPNVTPSQLKLATTQHALTGKLASGAGNLTKGLGVAKAGLGLLKLIDTPITIYNGLASLSNNMADMKDKYRGYDPETHTQKPLDPAWANNPWNKAGFGLRLPMSPTIVGSVLKQIPALNPNGDRNIFHNGDFIDETAEGIHNIGTGVVNKTQEFLNRYPMFGRRF